MKSPNKPINRNAAGFTLIELAAAVFVIGILAVIISRALSPSQDGARAQALFEGARKMGDVVVSVAQNCTVSTAVSGNVIPDSTATKILLDVIREGNTSVATAYRNCHRQAGIVPLAQVLQAGNRVQGYGVTLSGGGSAALSVAYALVPTNVVEILATKYGSGTFAAATPDITNRAIQYSAAAANGTHTLTVLVPL